MIQLIIINKLISYVFYDVNNKYCKFCDVGVLYKYNSFPTINELCVCTAVMKIDLNHFFYSVFYKNKFCGIFLNFAILYFQVY